MTDNHPLIAYFITIAAICYLSTIWALLTHYGHTVEASGIATIVVGLLALANAPRSRTTTIANTASDPVPLTSPKAP